MRRFPALVGRSMRLIDVVESTRNAVKTRIHGGSAANGRHTVMNFLEAPAMVCAEAAAFRRMRAS